MGLQHWRGVRVARTARGRVLDGARRIALGHGIRCRQKEFGYSKFSFTLGWQNNVMALLRGHSLDRRVAELERQRQLLTGEISARQQRISSLELEINRYQAQNLLELEQRRAQAEQELRSEREALQRLEDRLHRLEQDAPPSTTPQ